LAAAYYLAKDHGITNGAVVERGWLAGGNIARNTAIIRSNYLDESAAITTRAQLRETLPKSSTTTCCSASAGDEPAQ
jgi:sarcosine oxidase subunit beta